MGIIHDPNYLMNLDRNSLDEILLKDYKNSALLRELLRKTLYQLKVQTELCRMEKDKSNEIIATIKCEINELLDMKNY